VAISHGRRTEAVSTIAKKISCLNTSLTEILEQCKEHPLQEEDIASLSNLLEQFNCKKEKMDILDEKILALVENSDDDL